MTAKGHLLAAFRRWNSTYSTSGEVVEHGLQIEPDDATRDVIPLYEGQAAGLVRLLSLDAAARGGFGVERNDDAVDLTVAALRIRSLLDAHGFAPVMQRRRADDLVRLVAAHSRLLRAAARVLPDAAAYARDSREFLANPYAEPDPAMADMSRLESSLRDIANLIDPSLNDAAEILEAYERHLIDQRELDPLPASFDGLTLLGNFCIICVPHRYAAPFHVRIFSPAEGPRVVVVGELTDNSSSSLARRPTKVVERISQALGNRLSGNETWVYYLPFRYPIFSHKAESDEEPSLDGEDDAGWAFLISSGDDAGQLARMTMDELDELVDGKVKRWHARWYTSHLVMADGAELIDVGADRRLGRPDEEGEDAATLVVRCGRWFCGAVYDIPVTDLPSAECPVCSAKKLTPIRLVNSR